MSDDYIPYPTNNASGWLDAKEGDGLVMSRPTRARGTVQKGKAPTLTCCTGCGTGVVVRDPIPERPPRIEVVGDLNMEGRHEMCNRVYGDGGVSPCLPTGAGGGHIPAIRVDGNLHVEGRFEQANRVYGTDGVCPTIQANGGGNLMPQIRDDGRPPSRLRIRFLTPLECWRLMGFPDSAFEKAASIGTSKTQLYKQAGNSIVVDCLMAIFDGMYVKSTWDSPQKTLEDWS